MAITVRYGDAGVLGSLAKQAGEGDDFWRRFSAEQQLVDSARRMQQANRQQQLEALRLQQVGRRTSAIRPTAQPTRQMNTPLVQQVTQARQQFVQPNAVGGTGTVSGGGTQFSMGEDGAISGQRQVRGASGELIQSQIPESEIQTRGGMVAGVAAPNVDPRQQYIQTVLSDATLNPQQQAEIAQLMNLNLPDTQLRTAVDSVRRRSEGVGGLSGGRITELTVRDIDRRLAQAERDARNLEEDLRKREFDPSGPPTQFNPVVDPNADGGFFSNIGRGLAEVGSLGMADTEVSGIVDPGDPQAQSIFTELARRKREIEELRQRRQQMLQGGGANTPSPTNPPAGDPSDQALLDLLRKI